MTTYILRRIVQSFVVVIFVTVMVFLVMRLLPGDPVLMLVTSGELQEFTQEQIDALREELGLTNPLYIQYVDWLRKAVSGDLGKSLLHRYDIAEEIKRRLPVSLHLGAFSFIIGITVGSLLGAISALRRGKWVDMLVTVAANIGITAPPFWLGILLIYILGLYLGWLPIYGYTSPFVDFGKSMLQSIMPIFCMSLFPIASTARLMRSSVIEVIQQDYIRTAWSKGLNEKIIVIRHVLKNALMPVVTMQGTVLRNIIGGSVVIETVFFVPGMGLLLTNSILAHDYTVVQGIILILALAVVFSNLVIDIIYGWLDPRIQYE
ncbi:MAG: ABC transporter permease [Firmicutes bacterium]|nr:ABC transporter permease [Bacillota bacterium]